MPTMSTGTLPTMTFENLTVHAGNQKAAGMARYFVKRWPDVRKGLLLTGPPGTGKTLLATAIYNQLGGAWVNVSQLIADLRPMGRIHQARQNAGRCYATIHGNCGVINHKYSPAGVCRYCPAVNRATLPGISDAPVLYLDDLGIHKPSDWAAEIIYGILDERAAPVVATTNYKLDELSQRLGHDRIVSRLCGLAHVQQVTGADWRMK
ncbi:MAG TPA: hypothetical protein DEF34_04970 [Desulfotomaculum sp.]|nr:hypothetical protein [Desulfotomaculum sp.]